jgi:opacity protein-like surface antigen
MLKKLFVASAILAVSTTVVFANGVPYVGAGAGIKSTNGERYMPLNVFAGYGAIVSSGVYLAGELGADLTSVNLSNTSVLKTTYGLAASVIPGIMLSNNTMLYGRLGMIRSKFSTRSANGGQLGLGMETRMAQNVALRGEYIYTAYHYSSSPKSDQFNLGLIYKFE